MTQPAYEERLMQVLLEPRMTEKSARIGVLRQYVFKVMMNANKLEIKHAVEKLFDVKVDGVQVSRVNGKTRRFGRVEGKRKGWKKAYVQLAEGHKIELTQA